MAATRLQDAPQRLWCVSSGKCPVCGAEEENLEHFLLWCKGYEEERKNILKLQQPFQENKKQIIGSVLFDFQDKIEVESARLKEVIYNFWKIRERTLKTSD